MRLFDAHCHLQDERLAPALDAVVARAAAAGVARMVCCGSSEADWDGVAAVAARFPAQIVPAYGLHPWYAGARSPAWLDRLRERLAPPGTPVGEIGLDHALEPRDDAAQGEVFLAQLELSRALGRPATLHCRRAWGLMLELLAPLGPHPAGMLFHSFSGAPEVAARLVPLNAFFSFSGSITLSGNRRGRRALAAVPDDRLLIETDAPDLPPAQTRASGTPNEPANLVHVLAAAAEVRGWTAAETARRTWENAVRLFGGAL